MANLTDIDDALREINNALWAIYEKLDLLIEAISMTPVATKRTDGQ